MAEPLRIWFLIDGLGAGGAERSVAELARGLHERGHRVTVVHQHDRAGVRDELRAAGVPLVRLDARRWPGRLRQLRRSLRTDRPDVLHSTLASSNLLARLAAWHTSTACLTSFTSASYGPGSFLADRPLRRLVVRAADGWTARHLGGRCHAVSDHVADHMAEHLRLDRSAVAVVRRGRDRRRLGEPGPERRQAARARLGLADGDAVIVHLGRVEKVKGHLTLLDAWAAMAPDRPRARLLVAGRPGSASADVDRARSRLPADVAERVEVLGAVEDVGGLLAAADLLAAPSSVEGFPGAVIEALAMGLPVVASDLPAIREALGGPAHGILVPAGDAHALAGALAELADDPARRAAMGQANRDLFEECFTLDHELDAMEALYRSLAP